MLLLLLTAKPLYSTFERASRARHAIYIFQLFLRNSCYAYLYGIHVTSMTNTYPREVVALSFVSSTLTIYTLYSQRTDCCCWTGIARRTLWQPRGEPVRRQLIDRMLALY